MKNKFFKIILLGILVFSSVFFVFEKPVRAISENIIINEIMYNPVGSDDGREWIEVFNLSNNEINLENWKFFEANTNHGLTSKMGGFIIPSGGYAVIADNADKFLIDYPNFSGILLDSSFSLSNSGESLALKDNNLNIIDEVTYSSEWGASGNGKTLERKNLDETFLEGLVEKGTPGAENSVNQPPPVCDNDSICESGENYSNCPADCPNNNNGGELKIYVPRQVQPGDILINEIFPQPDATKGESEWIEFYNHSDAALDLTGWTLEDNTAKPQILSGIILAPHQYYVLEKNKFGFVLNNGGDTLILKNNQVVIDKVTYGDYEDGNADDNAPASGLSKSIGRQNAEPMDTDNDKNDFNICQSITPGRTNDVATISAPQPSPVNSTNASVIISEFLPNPVGSDNNEWIELYNSGLSAIDLTSWQLDDGEGGSSPYTLPSGTAITASGYLVLPRSQTKIVLNNNFDTVRLIRPDKAVQEQINYRDPPEGASYARDGSDSWQYASVLTPGSANVFNTDDSGADGTVDKTASTNNSSNASSQANVDLTEVDSLPQLDNGQNATIKGLVVALPGLFAKSYFYLNGAQIYSAAAKFPELQIGDLIEVKGTVSSSFSNRRLKIKSTDDIQILEHQNLTPQSVAIGELDDSLIGHFLQINGQLIDKTGSKLYLDDNQDEVEIYLSPAIKWNKKIFKEGQILQVNGILAEAKDGWRLLPRSDNDLTISAATVDNSVSDSQGPAPAENKNSPGTATLASSAATVWQNLNRPATVKYLFLSAGIIIIFLAGIFLKLKGII